jgi:hypothetical protein
MLVFCRTRLRVNLLELSLSWDSDSWYCDYAIPWCLHLPVEKTQIEEQNFLVLIISSGSYICMRAKYRTCAGG